MQKQAVDVLLRGTTRSLVLAAVTGAVCMVPAMAQSKRHFTPGSLVVSRSQYDNLKGNVKVGQILPPNCAATTGGCGASTGAPFNGLYPQVFNNALYDASFGITSAIFLDQLNPFTGYIINTLEVPNSRVAGVTAGTDQMVTSFSSKSELSLHRSLDNNYLTFMGYNAPANALDVSNSNTPGVVDPTNPVGESYYRAVAQVDAYGNLHFTETNAYSGNNGRSAILNNVNGDDLIYTAGNAGNGGNPQPEGVVVGAGAQILTPAGLPEADQTPQAPAPVASFSITELGKKADKIGKDDNFRGETVFNNVLYYTKGSGSNGVNTVYFVDTVGGACPNGVGLPLPGATLPATPLSYDPATVASTGLPNNVCILAGFPAVPNKTATVTANPFGLFFANATTLYVADEGDGAGGATLYSHAAAQTAAGLQKWIFNSTTDTWQLAYTLQTGLNLGVPYTVAGYPTGTNSATGLPWAPATDGLRNIEGYVTPAGQVYLWAITSTVSGSGDQGADPNQLLTIVDSLANTDPAVAAAETFSVLKPAGKLEVLRGVSLTPGTTTLKVPTV